MPIIVAINKIDKPDAQIERIKQQLADRGLLAEDWGGDIVMVPVSARAKTNLDLLLEMILLVAEMLDLKANPDASRYGQRCSKRSWIADAVPWRPFWFATARCSVGDYFICGSVFGKRARHVRRSRRPVREVGPSMPAEVLGLDSLPEVGDTFQVVTDTAKAKQIVIYREAKAREVAMSKTNRITLEQLHEQLKEGEVKELNIILKTDVGGTAEVLTDTLQKLSNDKVRIRVLHCGRGRHHRNRRAAGFGLERDHRRLQRPAGAQCAARWPSRKRSTSACTPSSMSSPTKLKRAMTGMLEPVFKEVYQGRAQVREVFRISKVGNVAGCMVIDGLLKRDSEVRLLRDNVVVFTGKIES